MVALAPIPLRGLGYIIRCGVGFLRIRDADGNPTSAAALGILTFEQGRNVTNMSPGAPIYNPFGQRRKWREDPEGDLADHDAIIQAQNVRVICIDTTGGRVRGNVQVDQYQLMSDAQRFWLRFYVEKWRAEGRSVIIYGGLTHFANFANQAEWADTGVIATGVWPGDVDFAPDPANPDHLLLIRQSIEPFGEWGVNGYAFDSGSQVELTAPGLLTPDGVFNHRAIVLSWLTTFEGFGFKTYIEAYPRQLVTDALGNFIFADGIGTPNQSSNAQVINYVIDPELESLSIQGRIGFMATVQVARSSAQSPNAPLNAGIGWPANHPDVDMWVMGIQVPDAQSNPNGNLANPFTSQTGAPSYPIDLQEIQDWNARNIGMFATPLTIDMAAQVYGDGVIPGPDADVEFLLDDDQLVLFEGAAVVAPCEPCCQDVPEPLDDCPTTCLEDCPDTVVALVTLQYNGTIAPPFSTFEVFFLCWGNPLTFTTPPMVKSLFMAGQTNTCQWQYMGPSVQIAPPNPGFGCPALMLHNCRIRCNQSGLIWELELSLSAGQFAFSVPISACPTASYELFFGGGNFNEVLGVAVVG